MYWYSYKSFLNIIPDIIPNKSIHRTRTGISTPSATSIEESMSNYEVMRETIDLQGLFVF